MKMLGVPLCSGGHPWLPVNAASSRVFLSESLTGLQTGKTWHGAVQRLICAQPARFSVISTGFCIFSPLY